MLTHDPLHTHDASWLAALVAAAGRHRYIVALDLPPLHRQVAAFTDAAVAPGTELPGGRIVRQRYSVAALRRRLHQLQGAAP